MEAWLSRDPVRRLETYLRDRGLVEDADLARIAAEAKQRAAELRDAVAGEPASDPAELFEHVYAQPSHSLVAQREFLLAEIADADEDGEA